MDIPPDLWPDKPQHQREALYKLMDVLVEIVVGQIEAEKSAAESRDPWG